MKLKTALRGIGGATMVAAGCMATSAWAAVPVTSMTLTFPEPVGIVGPTDSIPVMLRLTNADASTDFVLDSSLPDAGLDSSWLPLEGNGVDPDTGDPFTAPFAAYTSVNFGLAFGCSGTFTTSCIDGPPYTFQFAAVDPFGQPFTVAAAGHVDYLLGTFVPSAGPVAPGTYEFYRGVLAQWTYGKDAAGNDLNALGFPLQTCNFDSAADCASVGYFTRTVVAVPEPGGWALMALGLLGVGRAVRRRP